MVIMAKKVLILSSSPIKGGNSDLLCDEFARGAAEVGAAVEKVHLCDQEIHFCTGCETCVKTGAGCVQQDDMAALIEKVHAADVFVLATPIYFMSVSAQLKVFIDRFIAGEVYMRNSTGKKAYFISVSASPDTDRNHLAANESFRGFLHCLRHVEEGGILNAGGAYAPGSIQGQDWMDAAYQLGKTV
jgi:multimeric flavodoxin WrbA